MTCLCINAGSSSLKVALFAPGPRPLARVAIERVHDHVAALDAALGQLGGEPPALVAHRIVHGGAAHTAPCWVDDALVASLTRLVPLAPLHQPAALAGIAAVTARLPGARQVACFDTAFHAQLPAVARTLPIAADVRRYGFHGLSYEYVLSVLAPVPPRLVIAHLGSGASLVAVAHGRSIDTTMGMTPDGGIPMGTRTGDLDPGVLLYLARERGLGTDAIERLVEREGGLVAIAGTADMKELLARDDAAARLAVELFAYAVKKAIGAYAAALGGLDLIVFTGGIGEHAARVRELATAGLGFLGADVRVIPTDEDLVMARHAFTLAAA